MAQSRRRWQGFGPAVTLALLVAAGALAADSPPADPLARPSVPSALAATSLLLDIALLPTGRLVAVGERGHVLISDDGGQTWQQRSVPARSTLTRVYFADARHGVIVGHDAVILLTDDAGGTWTKVYYAPEARQPLFDVWLGPQGHGLAVGAYSAMLTTEDFGRTWEPRHFAPVALAKPTADDADIGLAQPHLYSLRSGGGGRLYLAGEAGRLYASDNDGADWRELSSPYEGTFFSVLPLSRDSLVVAGLRGHAYRSDDGGKTFTALDTGVIDLLAAATALDGGGYALAGASGAVLVSRDGARLAPHREADRAAFSALVSRGPLLIAVGEHGVRRLDPASFGAAP